ncbi:hypothetical protein M3912_003414 [Vibrio metschnikovii]|nr:hypothetical protein [Vibrio metschnikovii]
MNNNVLISPSERKEKTLRNRKLVTKFLRDEIFTDTEVLSKVLGFEHSTSVNKILKAMVRDGLLIEHKHGRKSIWGINKNGLIFSYDENEEIADQFSTFRASKFNVLTFEHRKQMQLLRVHLIENGWSNWTTPRIVKGQSCPDAIAQDPSGHLVAFEFERTLKAASRYTSILKSHLEAISHKRYKKVVYISPDIPLVRRVERMFMRLIDQPMVVLNNTVTLSEVSFRALFEFSDINKFLSGN